MASGTSTLPTGRPITHSRRAALALAAALAATVCGCATVDRGAVLAEREAAMERWSGCVNRHAGLGETSMEAIEATRGACDGYRRDVTLTFAPHMARRVKATLEGSERRRVMDRRLEGAAARDEPLSAHDRMRERIDRLLMRTAARRGDG